MEHRFLLTKTCITCKAQSTSKWYSGPLCRKCYRAQDHIKQQEKQSRLKNIEKYTANTKKYALKNKESIAEKNKKWYFKNKEHTALVKKQYKLKKKHTINKYVGNYIKNRKKIDASFRIRNNLRSRLSKALKNNSKLGSAVKDLGCTIEELKLHLESKFISGMTWDNYGLHGWHIDHIKPLSLFDLNNPEEFKKACHYTNLQPMWAKDNLSKGNKHEEIPCH